MKYLLEAMFMLGTLAIGGFLLFALLRFIVMVWLVQLAERIVLGTLTLIRTILFTLIFVFAPAILGAFIIGLGLQVAASASGAADSTMPALIGLLAFFVILSLRIWQWQARRRRADNDNLPGPTGVPVDALSPDSQDPMTLAWYRAMKLAPKQQEDLRQARAACTALLAAIDRDEGIPDPGMIETATLIRNHLVPFVESMERRLQGASRGERKVIADELVRYLLGFGDRSRQALAAAGPDQQEQDAALHAHLSAQLFI